MSTAPLIAAAGDYHVYELPSWGRFLVVQAHSPPRPGPPSVGWAPELTALLRRVLGGQSLLYRAGSHPVFLLDGVPTLCSCPENSWAELHRLAPPATASDEAPAELDITSLAASAGTFDQAWREVCRVNQLRPCQYSLSNSPRMIHALGSSESITVWGGLLRHPIVGTLPPGWFGVGAPDRPPLCAFRALRSLFAPLPLDAASHARLYSYLLACFAAESITCPMPLLVCDSWTQGIGKTECCSAIAELVNGCRSSLSPPQGTNVDELVAHYNAGHRLACLDNLQSSRPYTSAWLCTLLSDRTAAARAKYSATTASFAGRLATLTLIWGDATLHPDLISRTWRVQLWGGKAQALAHRPNAFAALHRREMQAACYWTVRDAAPWPDDDPITDNRCGEAERVGAAAYAHLFGLTPADVRATLSASERDVRALSAGMARFLRRTVPELSGPVSFGAVTSREDVSYVLGARAMGYRAAVKDGKPHAEECSVNVRV